MNQTSDIKAVVNGVLEEWLPIGVQISDQSNLVSDLGFDSARTVDVVLDLEARLDITIPVDRIVEIETVNDLCRAVEGLVRKSA